jgi:hypothetical protein
VFISGNKEMQLHPFFVSAIAGLVAMVSANAQSLPGPTNGTNVAPGPWGGGFRRMMEDSTNVVKLGSIHLRDVCILPDQASRTYYMVGPGFRNVRAFTSKDLVSWQGPQTIYRPPTNVWGDIPVVNIWAPEMHMYKGKYYLFLTFDTRNRFTEQWRDWLPRVTRGSQVLEAEKPTGPFVTFTNHSTLPMDMMTLDGTFWVEDGTPYMVFCHEWVQIKDGTVEYVRLKDDLSVTDGEPKRCSTAATLSGATNLTSTAAT